MYYSNCSFEAKPWTLRESQKGLFYLLQRLLSLDFYFCFRFQSAFRWITPCCSNPSECICFFFCSNVYFNKSASYTTMHCWIEFGQFFFYRSSYYTIVPDWTNFTPQSIVQQRVCSFTNPYSFKEAETCFLFRLHLVYRS